MEHFLKKQTRVISLGDEYTPSAAITQTITQTDPAHLVGQELEIWDDAPAFQVVNSSLEDEELDFFLEDISQERTIQEAKDVSTIQTLSKWLRIQEFWSSALTLASRKFEYLRNHPFEVYVRRMNNRALKVSLSSLMTITPTNTEKSYFRYIQPGCGDLYDLLSPKIRPSERVSL